MENCRKEKDFFLQEKRDNRNSRKKYGKKTTFQRFRGILKGKINKRASTKDHNILWWRRIKAKIHHDQSTSETWV